MNIVMDVKKKQKEPKKEIQKENLEKRRITIHDKNRKPPLPRIEYMSVQDLFDLLQDNLKIPSTLYVAPIKYPELQTSLDSFGYKPKDFDLVSVKKIHNKLRVINGKKRILLLYLINPKLKIDILYLRPFKNVVRNPKLKRKALEKRRKLIDERKNYNSKNSN